MEGVRIFLGAFLLNMILIHIKYNPKYLSMNEQHESIQIYDNSQYEYRLDLLKKEKLKNPELFQSIYIAKLDKVDEHYL